MFLEIYYFGEIAPHDILQLKLILPCHKNGQINSHEGLQRVFSMISFKSFNLIVSQLFRT